MEEKQCSICKETKSTSEFRRDKTRKDGFHPYCKVCQLQYRRKDPDNLVRLEGERRRHEKYNKGNGKETSKLYQQSEVGKASIKKSFDKRVKNGKLKSYHKDKYDNDIEFKIRHNLSGRVRDVLRRKGNIKDESVKELIGCTLSELRIYLESQFEENMSWDNYGMFGWHIDHIIPCSDFILENNENQKICFHYLNLQPLWREENCHIKGAKVPGNKQEIINKIKIKLGI